MACSTATIVTLDPDGNLYGTSVALGDDGLPLISYRNYTSKGLQVIHCSNVFCVPYFRRR